jgi:hypothetical protein
MRMNAKESGRRRARAGSGPTELNILARFYRAGRCFSSLGSRTSTRAGRRGGHHWGRRAGGGREEIDNDTPRVGVPVVL